jgi:hypothetical protein
MQVCKFFLGMHPFSAGFNQDLVIQKSKITITQFKALIKERNSLSKRKSKAPRLASGRVKILACPKLLPADVLPIILLESLSPEISFHSSNRSPLPDSIFTDFKEYVSSSFPLFVFSCSLLLPCLITFKKQMPSDPCPHDFCPRLARQ